MVVTRGSYTEFQAVEVANAVNQGSVSDPKRYIYGLDYPSTARFIRVDSDGRLETVAAKENDYSFSTYGLGATRDNVDLSLSGESVTIFKLQGSCSIRLNGTAHDPIELNQLTWPSMVVFDMTFTNLYLTNTSQAGTLTLHIGKRGQ